MTAYYNEHDAYAAEWLRNLIAAGHIAPGVVDERSIEDVFPDDLRGFTQCHFFAGIGIWSLALRQAGWDDSRPVWTGSCPCQPFSSAGKGAGFADERHLWPAFFHLIGHRRPPVVFGEQVASKDAEPWIDLVQDDLEGLGYAVGAVPFPAAGVGAPHIRDRLYWVGDSHRSLRGRQATAADRGGAKGYRSADRLGGRSRTPVLMGNAGNEGLGFGVGFPGIPGGSSGTDAGQATVGAGVHIGELVVSGSERRIGRQGAAQGCVANGNDAGRIESDDGLIGSHEAGRRLLAGDDDAGLSRFAGLRLQRPDLHDADGRRVVGGFWADADWVPCRDNKWRPVEPGSFPLAHGAPARVGRLRAYGNAICAQAAQVFIEATMNQD